MILVVFRD